MSSVYADYVALLEKIKLLKNENVKQCIKVCDASQTLCLSGRTDYKKKRHTLPIINACDSTRR